MKTTCRKSWPGNLFQVLNLTPASRLNEVVTLKRPYFSLISGAMASDCKDHEKQRPWSRDCMSVCTCVCFCIRPCVHLSGFNISLKISFNYKDIFIKFAENVYGYKNLSLQNFGLILKNKMATIANCLKIIKLF